MLVRITQANIDEGLRGRVTLCPLALALIRQGRGESVTVKYESVHIGNRTYWLSSAVENWIRAFDAGGLQHPGTFRLDKILGQD